MSQWNIAPYSAPLSLMSIASLYDTSLSWAMNNYKFHEFPGNDILRSNLQVCGIEILWSLFDQFFDGFGENWMKLRHGVSRHPHNSRYYQQCALRSEAR